MAANFQRQVRTAYWLGWVPLSALVIVLLYLDNGLALDQAMVAGIVLSLFYAIVCRSGSYMCTSLSLSKTRIPRLVVIFVSSSLAAAGFWVMMALGLGKLIPVWAQGLESKVDLLFGLGVALYLFAAAFHYTVLAVFQARRAETAAQQSRTLAKEAQLRALRAQVDPHFLFNSLNSIAALTLSDSARSRQMCLQLAEFLRSTQGLGNKEIISLEQELELVRQYLSIEQQRFSDRMRIDFQVPDECLKISVPALLLQPLAENAVKHGVGTLPKDAWIRLGAKCDERMLYVSLSNPYDPLAGRSRGTGRGIALVRDRLEAYFGTKARMHRKANDGIWSVELQIPIMEDNKDS